MKARIFHTQGLMIGADFATVVPLREGAKRHPLGVHAKGPQALLRHLVVVVEDAGHEAERLAGLQGLVGSPCGPVTIATLRYDISSL